MTRLSVNVNKVALLRNARGRNFPDVCAFASRCLELGAHGITIHPRPDERHARYRDIADLAKVCREHGRELNVEGYPSNEFLSAVEDVCPEQCTLVPDAPGQLTSDHGWDFQRESQSLIDSIHRIASRGIRVSLFVDFDNSNLALARQLGAQRVELYTEPFAEQWAQGRKAAILPHFQKAAQEAQAIGLGVNAGHDLNLDNLSDFLTIPDILEVSIGHAFIVECIELGVAEVVRRYLEILRHAS
ncbi:MAG: pyridoxine 5'-phosphate synthase [Burkholderiaceae bacterium]|jgi:pyridoxine 5-phosphate synthase